MGDKHAERPGDLSYCRDIRSPEQVEDGAEPHEQEEQDRRADKEPPEHALPESTAHRQREVRNLAPIAVRTSSVRAHGLPSS